MVNEFPPQLGNGFEVGQITTLWPRTMRDYETVWLPTVIRGERIVLTRFFSACCVRDGGRVCRTIIPELYTISICTTVHHRCLTCPSY